MVLIKAKGYEINAKRITDSFSRRAQKFKNNIIASLRQLGLTEDDCVIDLEPNARKKLPAEASWYVNDEHLYYSYNACDKFVENLYVVSKVIELEVKSIISGEKSLDQFVLDFKEDHDIKDERLKAREVLGIDKDSIDLDSINKRYKKLAKELHPDMPGGDLEKFKEVNHAHKVLKRELQ